MHALGLRSAVHFAVDLGLQEVETKCAFKSLVEEVKSAGHTNLWISHILNDVKVLDSSIRSICFSYYLSQANRPAEKLACDRKNHIDVIYWLEESLPCIMSLLDSDIPIT